MNKDWRSRNTFSGRDAAKAAVTIIALLVLCIAVGWVVTRVFRSSQPPSPPATTAPAEK